MTRRRAWQRIRAAVMTGLVGSAWMVPFDGERTECLHDIVLAVRGRNPSRDPVTDECQKLIEAATPDLPATSRLSGHRFATVTESRQRIEEPHHGTVVDR